MTYYLNRQTKKIEREAVYGGWAIRLAYASPIGFVFRFLGRIPLFSRLYARLQKGRKSKKKVAPFIQKYCIDTREFLLSPEKYQSFDDFFTRKLDPKSRPIASEAAACCPADGRILCYQDISSFSTFFLKGKEFSLEKLLQDPHLSREYEGGSLAMCRLCPTDYHRFHFPFDCLPSPSRLINGYLYSVNPKALLWNANILCENKRMVTECQTESFGKVLYIEIGATFVGSIHQTYSPHLFYKKGDEKGYFSFGGSLLLLLFKKNTIQFNQDLIDASRKNLEVRCLLGQNLGTLIQS